MAARHSRLRLVVQLFLIRLPRHGLVALLRTIGDLGRGPLAAARGVVGDMAVQMHRSRDALAEYEETLVKEPNRYRSMYGAMLAAREAGEKRTASRYEQSIAAMRIPPGATQQ